MTISATADHAFLNDRAVCQRPVFPIGPRRAVWFRRRSLPGTGGTCTTTLNNGASCSIVIRFTPTVSGLATDQIQIDYNNGSLVTSSVRNIEATGATPALLTISHGATYNYGAIASGGSANHAFTVTNTGGSDATGITEVGLAAPFGFAGGSYPLAAVPAAATFRPVRRVSVVAYSPAASRFITATSLWITTTARTRRASTAAYRYGGGNVTDYFGRSYVQWNVRQAHTRIERSP